MTYKDLPYYPEYMERESIDPPRYICDRTDDGIEYISPSKNFYYLAGGGTERQAAEVHDFWVHGEKYICYQRLMSKERWKSFYRKIRIERREAKVNEHI